MKKTIFFGLALFSACLIGSCDESEDPVGLRDVGIVPSLYDANPAVFDSKDLENTFVKFKVALSEGDKPEKAELYVSYNGAAGSVKSKKVSDIANFPADVTVYATDAVQALGIALEDLENDDVFTFEVVFTSHGGKVTRSNSLLNVPVACAFDPAQAFGSYRGVSDGWEVDGPLTITQDEDDPYTVYVAGLVELDGAVEDLGPLKMTIDPITFAVKAEKTALGSDFDGYHNVSYQGTGIFGTCDGKYTMSFTITVDGGSFGLYSFTFTRN